MAEAMILVDVLTPFREEEGVPDFIEALSR
jgi:hypothetical protein